MLLDNLDGGEVGEHMVTQALRIMIEELAVTELEYVQYQQQLRDPAAQRALFDIRTKLFIEN